MQIVRCETLLPDGSICNRFLGRFIGQWEVKCPRCKLLKTGINYNFNKPYDKVKGE